MNGGAEAHKATLDVVLVEGTRSGLVSAVTAVAIARVDADAVSAPAISRFGASTVAVKAGEAGREQEEADKGQSQLHYGSYWAFGCECFAD